VYCAVQINQPTKSKNYSRLLLDVYVQLNMFRRPHAHQQQLNNCSSSLWFYRWSVVIAVLLVMVGPTGYFIRFRKDMQELGCYKIIFHLRGKQTRQAEVQPAEMRSGGNQCPVVEQ
jgi:hypothetical protein